MESQEEVEQKELSIWVGLRNSARLRSVQAELATVQQRTYMDSMENTNKDSLGQEKRQSASTEIPENGMPPITSAPIYANYPSEKLTIGAGVAIFHIASERVVVCYHTRDKYWFLPKGRKNANEDVCRAAEREGFEESGYRNRLIPLPMKHRAPDPDEGHEAFVTEPIWTQLLPLTATSQYMLFWYAAETLPPEDEQSYVWTATNSRVYRPPSSFPSDITLKQRLMLDKQDDGKIYEPVRHEGTGVDDEERLYRSELLTIDDARKKLTGSVMEDVVKRGWDAIHLRLRMETLDAQT